MKILFIFYDRPNYFAGPIVNARRLLPELFRRGHEIHCLTFYSGDHAPSAQYLRDRGVNCYLQPFKGYTEQKITWILEQVAIIAPDIFVPNLSVAGWFAAHWVRQSEIPTIAVHRSDDAFHWAMVSEFVLGQQKWAVSGLVCVSKYLCGKVNDQNPEHTKLCVIPSGVPVPSESANQEGTLKLIYIGRLVQEQKKILDLVEALSKVMHILPQITATIIGDGEELFRVNKRIEELGLTLKINNAGTCDNEEIHKQLLKHHVLVLLSDYEGTPGAVMDAMACGVVPVCLNIPGGVQELVTDKFNGLLVKDRAEDFVEAIKLLSNDVDLRKYLAHNAKQHIAQNFSLQIAADRWEKFCAELMHNSTQKQSLFIPKLYDLPPVRKGLDREDRRILSFPKRLLRLVNRIAKKIYFTY